MPHHVGTTFSTDLFYVPEPGSAFGGYEQSAWRERYADIARTNAIAAEMETSVLLVLARIWGLRAGALALVSDAVDDTSESGEFVPEATFDVSAEPIDRLARVGCETARILDERDRDRLVPGWATVEEAPAQRNLVLILARAFAAQIATAVFLLDEEGTIIYYNEAAERLTGRPFIEGAGMTAGDGWRHRTRGTTPAT